MKVIPILSGLALLGCQSPPPAHGRPPMDSAMAEKLCTDPAAVHNLGAECVLRDQSPPPEVLPRPGEQTP